MCACRCGIDVHLRDGRVRYIQGNRDHPVNRGVLCAKGSAGMLHLESPARLTSPLRRTGPRGRGEFRPISWDEAMDTAAGWLAETRRRDPRGLAFFTGRDQSQALTGWWAQQYGTMNHAAHGGFCSVNMAAGGIYSIGGSFWEFAQPDWQQARLLLLFGVAEDHDSNPIKLGLAEMRRNGAHIVSINPVRTGYSAIANTWLGIRPGTDGLLVLSLIGELLRNRWIDVEALQLRTNAPWLVQSGAGKESGLFLRDAGGKPQIIDSATGSVVPFDQEGASPALTCNGSDARSQGLQTVFELLTARYLDPRYRPDSVAGQTGISAAAIRGLAAEIARAAFEESFELDLPWTDFRGIHHRKTVARPVAIHAMRGISAHANGFQTCRSLHVLQMLIGSVDCPGGTRFKPPYPKPVEIHPRPGRPQDPGQPLTGPPLGYPLGPEDLLVDAEGEALRLDKAFSWEAPLAAHGMMHSAIPNAADGDPYPVDVMFLYMANMAWNSSMNTPAAIESLTAIGEDGEYRIPRLIVADAFWSETTSFADLVLPDTTYLERHDCISLADRPIGEPHLVADAIRQPVVTTDRDVRPFQDVLLDLGARLELPGFVENGGPRWQNYAHYMTTREIRPGVGPLAGWRGADGTRIGRGEPNEKQLDAYVEAGCFWTSEVPGNARYFKHLNVDYQDWAVEMGFYDRPSPYLLQLYSEPLRRFQLAAEGHGDRVPPARFRQRIIDNLDPLPGWIPVEDADQDSFPLNAITQRPMAMYHSWGSQNPWLRQIHAENFLYVPGSRCDELGLADGDWVWVESRIARIRARIRRMEAVNQSTVWTWNAIGKRQGAWSLAKGAPEATRGFLLNHLIPERSQESKLANSDPVTGQAAWFDLRVRITRDESQSDGTFPLLAGQAEAPGALPPEGNLEYGSRWSSS